MRRLIKASASWALTSTGGNRLLSALTGHRRAPLIVNYHRVVQDFDVMRRTSIPAMLITSRTFEQQIDWIAQRYRITTLDEIGSVLESGRHSRKRLAAITFDDGYADLYHNAFPILRRKGHPAAVFVVSDLVGGKVLQSFDRLYLLLTRTLDHTAGVAWLCEEARPHAIPAEEWRKLGLLSRDPVRMTHLLLNTLPQDALRSVSLALESKFPTSADCLEAHSALDWAMLKEMSAGGITIGSHTRTHPLLTLEAPATVREEVDGSRKLLQKRLGREIDHFAYPDGRFNPQVVAAVKRAGYRFAYGVCEHRDATNPLLTIPRRTLWENSCLDRRGRFSPSVMHCNTSGVFDLFVPCRREHEPNDVVSRTTLADTEAVVDVSHAARQRGAG